MTRPALVPAALFAAAALSGGAALAQPTAPAESAGPAPTPVATRTITLDQAIALATSDNLAIDVGKDKIEGARAHERSTRTLRLPTLSVKANLLVWDSKIATEFAPGTPPIVLRNQVTGSVEVAVYQPLSATLVLSRLVEGDRAAVDAARAELDVTKLDLGFQAAKAYVGVLELQTLRELAETSVRQLEADLVKLRALRDARVLAEVDVLRLESARDQAQAGALQAEVDHETALRGLALLLDLPDGTHLAITPIDTTPPELGWSEAQAVAEARTGRPELRVAAARVDQAQVGVDYARAQYIPNIGAIASYTHSEQGGAFQIKDSAFVGVQLEWNLWDWGKRGADLAEARATHRQARRYREELDDQLAFDVRSKWLTASTRRRLLDVNQSARAAAEEAYRLQKVRIDAGVATSTDVIDAETEVARARAAETIARYEYLIAWMALVRAVGHMPAMPGATPAAPGAAQ